jgi:hypothetical protein
MSDGERDPPADVVLTSWDRAMSDDERDPRYARGGTGLMEPPRD